ncbi:MAG: PilZ domain-containing protein [Magnetococcales bacterium]|nr:PilZ domain-containing protein [Magnetococcales bacterium]
MSQSNVQGILKNTDLLLDVTEIRSLLATMRAESRPIELRAARDKTTRHSHVTAFQPGKSLSLARWEPESHFRQLAAGTRVNLFCLMGGYGLETTVACLEPPTGEELLLHYPGMFRVHSKRQASRFSTPLDMTSQVEMMGKNGQVRGELQDINQEGLSFLGDEAGDNAPQINDEVQLRLIPMTDEDPTMTMTGILRFSGLDRQKGGFVTRRRYSVQITGIDDAKAFQRYFSKIRTCSHALFRAAVMSSENYSFIAAI